jgi:hypothetical protein
MTRKYQVGMAIALLGVVCAVAAVVYLAQNGPGFKDTATSSRFCGTARHFAMGASMSPQESNRRLVKLSKLAPLALAKDFDLIIRDQPPASAAAEERPQAVKRVGAFIERTCELNLPGIRQ